jgi:uncharacterized membrane protein YfcA
MTAEVLLGVLLGVAAIVGATAALWLVSLGPMGWLVLAAAVLLASFAWRLANGRWDAHVSTADDDLGDSWRDH